MNKVYYQHQYGGIYTVDFHNVKSAVDNSEWVVYTHVWPFEIETRIRPKVEFDDGRFRIIAGEELKTAMTSVTRTHAQDAVNSARNLNRR